MGFKIPRIITNLYATKRTSRDTVFYCFLFSGYLQIMKEKYCSPTSRVPNKYIIYYTYKCNYYLFISTEIGKKYISYKLFGM